MKRGAGVVSLAAVAVAACSFAPGAAAQVRAGDILIVDPDVPPVSNGVLFQVDPTTGARTVLSNFGAGSPTAVAVEANGDILVTDTDAGTDPAGGTSEWGALYRLSPDPGGDLVRSIVTDFGVGTPAGRSPTAVTVAGNGDILVLNASGGTANRAVLVRVDPETGARTVVSDFGSAGQGALGVEPRRVAVEADGRILVIDAQAGTSGAGELVRVDPSTGFRTSVSNFGAGAPLGSNPTAVAIQADGQILVADEGHPSTTPLGLLFRLDPLTGARTVLSDFNTGANAGREPAGVALEADGRILVADKHAGALTRGMLFRVDPQSGDRALVSDFGAGANGGNDPLAVAVVPPLHGTLVVAVEVVNDDGGTAVAPDWTIAVTGANPVPASFSGAGPPGTIVTLAPGAHAVSANGPAGYSTTAGADCTGTIAAGETKTCTVSSDDGAPPPGGPCILLSDTAVDVGGIAATPAQSRVTRHEGLTVTNCGTSDVNVEARATDATGSSGTWQLTEYPRGNPVENLCELGPNRFASAFGLTARGNGEEGGVYLTTLDQVLVDPADEVAPFVFPAAAVADAWLQVAMPCVGSVGLGDPMTMDITLTATAP